MQVSAMIPLPGHDPRTMPNLKSLISDFAAAQNADNLTMQAIKQSFVTPSKETATSILPFSPAWKYSAVSFGERHYVLGAPELILRDEYDQVKNLVENYSADGNRVLLFACCEDRPTGEPISGTVTALALLLLSNPIRKDARETFRYFAEQGVQIKVISGDNPVTVSQIAREAGIEGAEHFVDASALSEDDLIAALESNTVFGRVTPEQKRLFVQAMKKAGHTVGMTGDGVNDILALKDADCSVAMASGCEAASQVSQLVLLENDFACMPSVVAEGRRVVNNIQRSASLFLVKNIFSLLMAVFSVCFHLSYPLEPAQVSLISNFTIGFPAFFLALQPENRRIEGKFLRNVLLKAFPAGITDFVVVGALVVFGRVFDVNEDEIATACTMLLAIVGFMILYRISAPLDWRRWLIWGASAVGLLGSSVFLGDLFGIEHMNVRCVMLFVVFAIATEPLLRYGIRMTETLGAKAATPKKKKPRRARRKAA
jgi:cation-transporting ATPase E